MTRVGRLILSGILAGAGACEGGGPRGGEPPTFEAVVRPAGDPVFHLGRAATINPWEHWAGLFQMAFLDDSTVLVTTVPEHELVAVGVDGRGRWRQGGTDESLGAFQAQPVFSTLGGTTVVTDGYIYREYASEGDERVARRIRHEALPEGSMRFPFGVYELGIAWWHADIRTADSDWQRLVFEGLDGAEWLVIDDLPAPLRFDEQQRRSIHQPTVVARGDLLVYGFYLDSAVAIVVPSGEVRRIEVPGEVARPMIDAHGRVWVWRAPNAPDELGAWVFDRTGEALFEYRGPGGVDAIGDLLLVPVSGEAGTLELHGLRVPDLSRFD